MKEALTEVLEAIEEIAKHISRFDPPTQPNYLVLSLGNQADTLRRLIQEPQRTWVGLTDEEAHELWESTDSGDDWELMKRTEAKLKEKNT